MLFNSFQFLIFFPIVLAVLFVIPKKCRSLWLLAASYYFYMCWNARYALLLLFSTAVTYAGAFGVSHFRREKQDGKAKLIMTAVLLANFGLLAYFKYANFLLNTLKDILNLIQTQAQLPVINVLLPVGISFYIFQAVGYTVDVYRGKLEPERNFLMYALFVSFFPQLVAGPIERSVNLLPQLKQLDRIHLPDGKRIRHGLLIMLYGFLLKMLIADRAAIAVDFVFSYYESYSGLGHLIAAFLFSIQIYCDFAGYSYIAIGSAKVMGITLMDNFRSPYLSGSIKEFWSRWHISLSSWFMDYLYIPLGGNRRGRAVKFRNLLIVFSVSGLWHGAAWHFVAWGLLHGLLRIAGEATLSLRERIRVKCGIREDNKLLKAGKILFTFLMVSLAWLLFRAVSLEQAAFILKRIFTGPWSLSDLITGTDMCMGLPWYDLFLLLPIFIASLLISDIMIEKKVPFMGWFEKLKWPVQDGIFILGILTLLMFGVYGTGYDASAFIYFQF